MTDNPSAAPTSQTVLVGCDDLLRYRLIFQVQGDGQLKRIERPEAMPESVLKHKPFRLSIVQVGYGEDLEVLGCQLGLEVSSD